MRSEHLPRWLSDFAATDVRVAECPVEVYRGTLDKIVSKPPLLAALLALLCLSCSVQYGEAARNVEEDTPEFVFLGTSIQRVEGGDVTVELKADELEQYKGGKNTYGRNVEFTTMTDGKVTAHGQCGLMSADTDKEEYFLFDGIALTNKEHGVDITAQSLKWDGNTQQLTSGQNDNMSIKKGGTVIYGSAFSASSISGAFAFDGAVSGEVDTDDSVE